jgi:Glucose / Sorbosone dehydrogenase
MTSRRVSHPAPAAGADEIFALGLRNPWRDSFDRGLGQFFVADVGAVTWEEVNLGSSGANYGWPNTEGPFNPAAFPAFTNPIHAYAHNGSGRSITGGYVFRGPDSDGLHGQYFFADFITGQVWTLHNQGGAWTATERTGQIAASAGTIANISSFGEDGRGNLYLIDIGGDIFRLDPLSPPPTALTCSRAEPATTCCSAEPATTGLPARPATTSPSAASATTGSTAAPGPTGSTAVPGPIRCRTLPRRGSC